MLRVPIAYAQQGMVLALPIFHPLRQDTMLLKSGMVLDDRTVARLAELRIKEFWIRYPGFDFVGQYICPEIQQAHGVVTRHISDAFEAVVSGSHARLDYSEYRAAIAGLLSRIAANPKAALFVQEMADRSQPALRHSSSVCLMSVLMGLNLEDYLIDQRSRLHAQGARDVVGLGLAAMMHDVGMMRLPAEIVDRWNRDQDEADKEFRAHVFLGFKMVREAIGPAAASAVLHHHQKFDGSGFPARTMLDGAQVPLAGRDIHVFARIIAAADLFDRLRYPPGAPPEAEPLPVVRVLKELQRQPYASWIDPVVFRSMLAVVPAYAPGSIVTLSSGARAVVVECFPEDPCRPSVRAIDVPPHGFNKPERVCPVQSLRDNPGLSIVEVDGHNVSGDNFTPDLYAAQDDPPGDTAATSPPPPLPPPPPIPLPLPGSGIARAS